MRNYSADSLSHIYTLLSSPPAKVTFTIVLPEGQIELPGHVDKEQSHQVYTYTTSHSHAHTVYVLPEIRHSSAQMHDFITAQPVHMDLLEPLSLSLRIECAGGEDTSPP